MFGIPFVNKKNLGRLGRFTKFTAKVAAVLLVGYTLGFRAHETGIGPTPDTLWSGAKSVVTSPASIEVWAGSWHQTKVGPSGNTDVVVIINPDGSKSFFDPETGSRDIKIQFVRNHRGFFGNLLRTETRPDPVWGEAGKPGGSSIVKPIYRIND